MIMRLYRIYNNYNILDFLNKDDLKTFLDQKYEEYHAPAFIDTDPIQIPHLFKEREDIEISGFLTATIAWGQRPTIIKNARRMIEKMDGAPFDFVINHQPEDLSVMDNFVHRTFNAEDLKFFIRSLQYIYTNYGGPEALFSPAKNEPDIKAGIERFRKAFFSTGHLTRSRKHVSDPLSNSACKRINMFLRWMVRKNDGVDFGIWKSIPAAKLSCPLDVHSGRVARKIGILQRKQNDWKAVEELDHGLRKLDPHDPVKYDFALFGLGVFEKF